MQRLPEAGSTSHIAQGGRDGRNRPRTGHVDGDAAGTWGEGARLDALGDFLADVDEDATRDAAQRRCRPGMTQAQIVSGMRGAGGLRGGQRLRGLA